MGGRGGAVTAVAACLAASSAAMAAAGDVATTGLRGRKWKGAHHELLKGTARHRQRALQEAMKQGTGDEVADEETASSSLFDSYNDQDPLHSNRDELIPDMDELLAMELTDSPAAAPPVAPRVEDWGPGHPSIHTGPHFDDNEVDPPSRGDTDEAGYGQYDNDDPPGGYGYFGGNKPREDNSDTDFKEFIAFVGWYAFLILCCLLPTLCAYYRRRRNARAMRDNFLNIQSRLAEIERRRNEEGVEVGMDGVLGELERENRDRDWELIEQIFGPIRGAGGNADPERRQRLMMLPNGVDILGSMSALVERERTRRAERGRRLVAALKETSLVVRECHLIEKGSGHQRLSNADVSGDGVAEGDNEGNTACDRCEDDKAGGPNNEAADKGGDGTDNNEEQIELTSSTQDDSNGAPAESSTAEAGEEGAETAGHSASSEPEATDSSQKASENDQTQTADLAVPSAPQSDPITSLYVVDELYEDDDDNKYTALCLPISDQSTSATLVDTTTADDATRQSQQRIVPPTCAICLVQYSPGCHVTWSSNSECTHAFHRDCILMWLLKKEEPLCPCCRQEFVPEAALNGDVEIGNDDGTNEETPESENTDSTGDAASALSRPPPQAQPRSVRYSNLPASFTIGGPGSNLGGDPTAPRWDSFSIGTRQI